MYMSESCICEDDFALTDELKTAREDEPEQDYKISPLYTLRRELEDAAARWGGRKFPQIATKAQSDRFSAIEKEFLIRSKHGTRK